ncbi:MULTISPECIES: hypothetical protein [unclassified Myroides]|uniref:hypothetical protein n=1 Tax=unclassified Myroides TaxID=2642485 RepID=UPI0031019496
MKRILLTLFVFGYTAIALAQEKGGIGIGIPLPDQSAILHIHSSDKGVLIPKVSLENNKDIKTIKGGGMMPESLLVYNTNTANGLTPGFYYWKKDEVDTANSKWIKLLTDVDKGTLLEGQKLPEFINQLGADGKLSDNFLYTPDSAKPNVDTLSIKMPELVKKHQTLTKLDVQLRNIWHLKDGSKLIVQTDRPIDNDLPIIDIEERIPVISYKDEKGLTQDVVVKDLLSVGETPITSLVYSQGDAALLFTNEQGTTNSIGLKLPIENLQTLTKFEYDEGKSTIAYTDEKRRTHTFNISGVVKTPWLSKEKEDIVQANTRSTNVFTNAEWVGIGYDEKSTIGGEALRIKGAITATNSYYADYVFEDYFDGESLIKPEYSFNALDVVEEYITTNRHLPGITPIDALEKNEKGYSFNVSELSIQLLEKTEELFLHTIELNSKLKQYEKDIELLRQEIQQLKNK